MTNSSLVFSLAFAFSSAACSSSSSSGPNAPAYDPNASPLDACSGTYLCTNPHVSSAVGELQRSADACTFGQLTLHPDGSTTSPDVSGLTWTGTASRFDLCVEGDCLDCVRLGVEDTSAPQSGQGGTCTGRVGADCGEMTPPHCSELHGCSMATSLNWDNSFNNYCTGTPDDCSYLDTAEACAEARCTWNP